TVTDALPAAFTVIGMNGPGWSCTPSTKTCSRSDVLPAGQDYPAITLSVFVASNAPSSIINWAAVGGGGEANVNNDAAADPTSIDPASLSSDLTITKSHTGNFTQGQTGATYTLSVHNVGGAPTNGLVTVTDTLPASLTATSISGGVTWNCTLSPLQCTRSDVLFDGLSYPPITVTVDVAAGAPASVTNTAAVSGGGETNTGNDLANDPTTIVPNGTSVADLTISKSHTGNFSQGQHGAIYTLLVQNTGSGPTSGQVTVVDTLPPQGLAISDMHGANWACVPNTMTCTRSDALPPGGSYEAIQVVVDVATGAPPSVTNHASVSGGGETNVVNDSAADVTTIDPFSVGPDLTIAKSHSGNFGQGETAAAYKLTVTNAGGSATTGTVSVTDALPQSLTIRNMEGQGWTCVAATKTCTRSDPLNAGASYPDITLTADVAGNAPATVTNTATVSGGGENNTANDTASDPTTIIPPTAGNHAPFGIGDAVQLAQGGWASEIVGDKNIVDSVIDNDVDLDSGDAMHAVQVSNPAHGTLVFHVDGTFVYTNTDNATTDAFTYKACDLFACSAPTTVTITIGDNLDNHAPFAVGDAIEVVPHGVSTVVVGDSTSPSSVLDNDLDFDADALTATKLSDPAHGTVALQADGTFSYQNDPVDPATSDGFLYEVCDPHGACDLGIVTITIGNGPPNTPPTVVDDAVQVAPGQQADTLIGDLHVPASVLDNDTDADGEPLTAKASDLVSGSGTLVFHPDGTFVYDNDPANPATSDSVLYQACDARGACKAGLISITITSGALDRLPSAQNDAIDVAAHGTATSLVGGATRLTANDTDPDPGETAMLVAHVISAPTNGHVTIHADGTFAYVNDDPALGSDQFAYEACDPEGACDAATVVVTIDTTAPAVTCVLPTQVAVVGDTVNLDLAPLFAPPAGDTLTYGVTNPPPTLSIIGSLLGGTLNTAGTFISTLSANAVIGGGTASEDVEFQVLPVGDLLLRDGFDGGASGLPCQ
ncbi:MAG TPA: Ig-like domain-containing protein, partial [Rhodanobacteraceae bacterium]